jgi:hypothetical protein
MNMTMSTRRFTPRLIALIAALAAACLVLAACGTDPAAEVTSGNSGDTDPAAETPVDGDADDGTGNDGSGDGDAAAPGEADPDDQTGRIEGAPAMNDYQSTLPMNELLDPQTAVIDELVVDDDDRTVRVRYQNGVEPCSGARVSLIESAERVEIRLETGANVDAAAMTCIAMIQGYEQTVTLTQPLGDRELIAVVPDGDQAAAPPTADDPMAGATFSSDYYIGLSRAEAEDLASTEGRDLRVAVEDGEAFMLTSDFSPSRVNIELVDGIVADAWGG